MRLVKPGNLDNSARMRALVVGICLWLMTGSALAQNWRDDDLGTGILEGVATRDHIWALGYTGKIVRFDRNTGARDVIAERAVDLLPDRGRLWALTKSDDGVSYSIRDLREPGLNPAEARSRRLDLYLHDSEHGDVLGLVVWPGQDRPAVIAARTVLEPYREGWRRRALAAGIDRGHLAATEDGASIFVGYNHGEWGGGLRLIEPESGTVSFVREASDRLCGGSLSPACAPVVGVLADHERPDCVLVGSGLSHLGISTGHVYRVCGSAITPVFSTPVPTEKDRWMMISQPWPLHALSETSDGWIGISRDRYFRSVGGRVTEHAMPAFNPWSGLRLSDEQDGVIFVVSACCWGGEDLTLYSAIALPILP